MVEKKEFKKCDLIFVVSLFMFMASTFYFVNEKKDLTSKLEIAHSDTDLLPYPVWIKDTNGIMMYINDSFINTVLTPLGLCESDILFKKMSLFGNESHNKYRQNDSIVKATKQPLRFIEKGEINGVSYKSEITKYPIIVCGKVVAVGGIANYIK